jgi:predicted transcriptional regulator YdeE
MKTVWVDGFAVTGREVRTSNAREMSGEGAIGKMWAGGAPSDSAIVVVYSEYESDKDGEYNYLLGTKAAPDGTPRREVEKGDYILLKFEGPITPEATVGLWRQVWDLESVGRIQRAYRTDFEVYGDEGLELYIGIKPKSS